MKAKPVKIVSDQGPVQCPIGEATHVTLHMPGPVGTITLPVILSGSRDGTDSWSWNGDTEKPTLKPSVLVRSGHFAPHFNPKEDTFWCTYNQAHPDEAPSFHCYICHTWVNDGRAIFLPDCSHALVNQTIDLLDIE